MVDADVTVELDFNQGFREGFLQGFMASYAVNNDCGPCDRDDCPRGE